jgi:hypothetical protein
VSRKSKGEKQTESKSPYREQLSSKKREKWIPTQTLARESEREAKVVLSKERK